MPNGSPSAPIEPSIDLNRRNPPDIPETPGNRFQSMGLQFSNNQLTTMSVTRASSANTASGCGK